ncbi:head maturation protease, ClpP-related [Mycobacterium sp. NAZ190054]|uniref:head maturation protease, ClpP-related n=1 Tax=Mycobacterium sp. NAZ190054 TaxID=1747766 RepID=UPI00079A1CB7|nr:head maturation protease, ClpP-related [Mycobacterium sp. NAZ190054]KWX66806.1 peptidase S14 [Mycobacterium sp. NAZ190054]
MNVTDWYQTEDAEPRQWYSVQNKADDPKTAQVEIYDDIIPFFGVNAADFRNELKALGDDIETIDLHVHSRGGNVYEAVAIMNTLRQHNAKVVTTVDSIAASAAGFIAVGASDELVVAENAEIMAHLPWVLSIGDANDMRKTADRLDQIGNNIASIFAEKAGGTVEEWLQVLTDETWWSAQEAVDAGIADRVLKAPKRKTAAKSGTKNSFDLSVFNHAGRDHAPAPRKPQAHNGTPQGDEPEAEKGKEPTVALSESALQKLGLDADADDSAIEEAINKLAERPTTVVNNAEPSAEDITKAAEKFGLTVMDKDVRDKLVADATAGAEARAQQVREANDAVIAEAVSKGKISPANAKTWRESLDGDGRDQALALLATLPENRMPVEEIGHGVSSENSPEDKDKTEMFAMVTGVEYGKDL